MPARPLSLHQLTALDAPPTELIAIAGELGCAHVCLFTHVPEQARHVYPLVTASNRAEVASALGSYGVTLHNLEVFPLLADMKLDELRESLELGAGLGASRATAHIHIDDGAAAAGALAAFCDIASEYGLRVGLEFNAFSKVRSLAAAAELVARAGRDNGDIVLDFLHTVRSRGEAHEITACADRIGYAQLCDGPAVIAREKRWAEAIEERMLPGDGAFPIAAMLRPLRRDIVIEVEVPQAGAKAVGVPPLERARRAVSATGRFTGEAAA